MELTFDQKATCARNDSVTHIFQRVQFFLALVSRGLGCRVVVLPLLLLTPLFICNLKFTQRL